MSKESRTTTWSDLPVEMVSEVIKYLDFKSRMQLRGTAKLEKAIVEATKMRFNRVNVNGCYPGGPHVYVAGPDGISYEQYGGFRGQKEKLVALTTSLMKYTKTKQFQLSAAFDQRHFMEDSIVFLEQVTERGGKFKFPVFNLNSFDDNDFQRAVELCDPTTEIISIFRSPKLGFERVFRDPLTLPVVLGASIIEIDEYENHIIWIKVIMDSWIKNNQIAGKKVLVRVSAYDDEWLYERDDQPREEVMVAQFKRHFEDRVVEGTPKSVRIRMDNTENHILMRILVEEDDRDGLNGRTRVVAIWEVIPAHLSEDGFTKNSGYAYLE